ncbi:MAG TPA: O-antigen ligase family protein [Polyangiaceae bacterium]
MALVGAFLLVFLIFIRPQEFLPFLQGLSIVNVATGLALLGVFLDVGSGRVKSLYTPQIPFIVAFVLWCMVTLAAKVGVSTIFDFREQLGFSVIFFLLIAYAVGSRFERFRVMAWLLVFIAVSLAAIGTHQSMQPLECIVLEKDENGLTGDRSDGIPIGINCDGARDCVKATEDYRNDYVCEKPGLFKTFSIGTGRVRWRGLLADPNDLSLAIGTALSFAFAIHASAKNAFRHVFFACVAGLVFYCIIQTASRGGVLIVLTVFATYFVRRYGPKGLLVGLILAAPLLLLGGREGEEAESSALERTGALYEGIDFFRQSPLFGLGYGQFTEHYFITAHNSYLLSAAELGFPGFFLWITLAYLAIKIPYKVSTIPPHATDPRIIPYAFALMTSLAGMYVGIFFLTFCYNNILWVYFGLSGALYLIAKKATPGFEVKVSPKELGFVALGGAALLSAIFLYTRIKGAP